MPSGQFFRNLAIKKPIVSPSALQLSGAAVPVWSQLSSGLNLWRRRSCSGDRPAPGMPSAPMWGSWKREREKVRDAVRCPNIAARVCESVLAAEVFLPEAEAWGRERRRGPRLPAPHSQPESLCRCCTREPRLSSAAARPAITKKYI